MQKLARVTDFKGNRWVDSVYHMSVFSECIVEQAVDVSEVLPQERLQQRTVERIVDVPVPQIWEETVSQVKENFIRRERVRNRTTEQIVASLSSRTEEGIARVWKDILQERVQQLMQRQVPTVQMAQKTVKNNHRVITSIKSQTSRLHTRGKTVHTVQRNVEITQARQGCQHACCRPTASSHPSKGSEKSQGAECAIRCKDGRRSRGHAQANSYG